MAIVNETEPLEESQQAMQEISDKSELTATETRRWRESRLCKGGQRNGGRTHWSIRF